MSRPLDVTFLGTYTVDPLAPHLRAALTDAGLSGEVAVGPFNQIVQTCLDEHALTAPQPDVLVVVPRFEDLSADAADDLRQIADAALAAAARKRACLVFVLPAAPAARPFGAGDAGRLDGVAANAGAVRERLRDLLAGRPGVLVADADEAVREVGVAHAHHPALWRFARIPYTEDVSRLLGGQIGRLVAARFAGTYRTVVLDGDSLLPESCPDVLLPAVAERHDAGFQLAVTVSGSPRRVREAWGDVPVAAWFAGERLAAVAAAAGPSVFVTADPELACATSGMAPVLLSGAPETWPGQLAGSALLDRLPYRSRRQDVPDRGVVAGSRPTLADYVARLGVAVVVADLDDATTAKARDVVARAKDFTLDDPCPEELLVPSPTRTVLTARVRDRLGDYGISAVAAIDHAGPAAVVDVFSLSCPVLGRGVEDRLLAEVRARAGSATVVCPGRRTGRNDVAVDFLTAAGHWIDRPR